MAEEDSVLPNKSSLESWAVTRLSLAFLTLVAYAQGVTLQLTAGVVKKYYSCHCLNKCHHCSCLYLGGLEDSHYVLNRLGQLHDVRHRAEAL